MQQSIRNSFVNGLKNGFKVSAKLIKTIIPFYIAVDLLAHTELSFHLGTLFSPLMKPFGLSGKMAVAIISGYLVNLYAAIAALVPLNPTWQQITVVGLMTGISHNLVVEGAILHKTGVNAFFTVIFRVIVSIIAGLLLASFFRLTNG